jgi:DNA-binding XRE family transcriptional regulator
MKNTELAQKIKELRIRKGLSQDKLAEAAQINLRTIQRIEEVKPSRGETHCRELQMHSTSRLMN